VTRRNKVFSLWGGYTKTTYENKIRFKKQINRARKNFFYYYFFYGSHCIWPGVDAQSAVAEGRAATGRVELQANG